ncbi:Zn(II)2Cys6 transcription factor [Aspergillus udagawae]|uniref:Zn(2)-C6 fungal-type domain-containing protein n=1 Tax=Aspergillus udagawae TaxID=91492 RepID=A0A8E0V535_9EURO|nr:uncharacterized protein Aud_001824 [Aspergillus udagawae]GIC94496.1 hypothetical protein Aud_001824 [Aspergillus udagawae]
MTVQKPSPTVAEPESSGKPNPPAPAGQSQPNPPPKKGKDKKIFSCHSCRRRKLKCDRFDPCGACRARGEGHLCTWEEGQRPECGPCARNHRETLEQLPKLILKLTEEVQELKTSNSALIENIRDLRPTGDREAVQWAALARISGSASLTGFVDVHQLICDVEEVQRLPRGMDFACSPTSLERLDIKVSRILACASLAAVDLDPGKAQELGLASADIDALVRDLWKGSRMLITSSDLDSFPPTVKSGFEGRAPPVLDTNNDLLQQTAAATEISLQIVSIKILLLLAARSFAAPSEYLKLHLDVISSAVDASLDSPYDAGPLLIEREWRWQLWSFICLLDWTSPGIYHTSSYFIRPEMYRDPPSKIPSFPDNGTYPSTMEQEQWDRLSLTRHYLDYALALAHLSRRAEDCIIRPGPVSPAQAAELCTELDALDNKLSFYQILASTLPAGSESNSGGMQLDTNPIAGDLTTRKPSTDHRLSLARAPQIQNMHLSLELGLIRFKLFRHEAFHLMHAPSTSGALRMMCMDACVDACILVLTQCRSIGTQDEPGSQAPSQAQMSLDKNEEKRPCTGSLRRVLQPASSAALVGQVLLHAAQGMDVMGMVPGKGKQMQGDVVAGSRGNSATEFFTFVQGGGEFPTAGAPMLGPGPYVAAGGSWSGRLSREKLRVLQWHINEVLALLEALQQTSSLARYKLSLHRQCM